VVEPVGIGYGDAEFVLRRSRAEFCLASCCA